MPTLEQARAWYQSAESVHNFDHVLRVYRTAERLAKEEQADLEIVRAAALLHDVADSTAGTQQRREHHIASAEFAGQVLAQEGWPEDRITAVQHCIRAHRFRNNGDEPQTIEAKVLFDADKLDVLGAIGVVRVVAYATLAGQPIYVEPSARFLSSGEKEPGEPHSAYHEHLYKLVKIKERLYTRSAKKAAEERDAYIRAFFERLIAESNGDL
jgi:uncharacterized protein